MASEPSSTEEVFAPSLPATAVRFLRETLLLERALDFLVFRVFVVMTNSPFDFFGVSKLFYTGVCSLRPQFLLRLLGLGGTTHLAEAPNLQILLERLPSGFLRLEPHDFLRP